MTKKSMKRLKKGDTVYVACKVDAVFINGGFIQVSTRDCNEGFDAYEDEVLEPSEDVISRQSAIEICKKRGHYNSAYYISMLPSVTPTQEPILDKIRAEIEQIIGERNLDDYDFCSGLICARNIIDKYKAEIINSTTKSDLAGDCLDIQDECKEEIEDLER